jgi:hypothetical protein
MILARHVMLRSRGVNTKRRQCDGLGLPRKWLIPGSQSSGKFDSLASSEGDSIASRYWRTVARCKGKYVFPCGRSRHDKSSLGSLVENKDQIISSLFSASSCPISFTDHFQPLATEHLALSSEASILFPLSFIYRDLSRCCHTYLWS